MSQKVGAGSAKLGFGRRGFDVVFSKAFEKGVDIGDVGRGVGVENYDVVEVGRYAVKVFDARASVSIMERFEVRFDPVTRTTPNAKVLLAEL